MGVLSGEAVGCVVGGRLMGVLSGEAVGCVIGEGYGCVVEEGCWGYCRD